MRKEHRDQKDIIKSSVNMSNLSINKVAIPSNSTRSVQSSMYPRNHKKSSIVSTDIGAEIITRDKTDTNFMTMTGGNRNPTNFYVPPVPLQYHQNYYHYNYGQINYTQRPAIPPPISPQMQMAIHHGTRSMVISGDDEDDGPDLDGDTPDGDLYGMNAMDTSDIDEKDHTPPHTMNSKEGTVSSANMNSSYHGGAKLTLGGNDTGTTTTTTTTTSDDAHSEHGNDDDRDNMLHLAESRPALPDKSSNTPVGGTIGNYAHTPL